MVNSLTKKTLQDLSKAWYELALGRATWLDVGAAFGYPGKKLVRYGNSKHSTEPIQQVIVTQRFRGDDIF